MARFETDSHFRKFCNDLEGVLNKHAAAPDAGVELLVRQRDQLRKLISLETEFREALIKHTWGANVYKDFVNYITTIRRNILAARPYFRERHGQFTRYISKALQNRNAVGLYKFRFNWSFVEWVLKARRWNKGSPIVLLANEIRKQRAAILEQNLPLAISQARIFWGNTPKSHLSYMDIVQIQCQGLLLAIDKFVPPNDARMSDKLSLARYRIFRAVAIGIMTRDRVNAYSETLVHFYPKDRMKIYRANKAMRRLFGDVDHEALAAQVNSDLAEAKVQTTPEEIQSLVAACSTVSADYSPDPDGETVLDQQMANEENRPDTLFEEKQALSAMHGAVAELDLLDKKVLRLRGIHV